MNNVAREDFCGKKLPVSNRRKTGEDGEGEKSNILLLQVEKLRNGEE